MNTITTTIVNDIAHHHAQAITKAGETVAHAQQVGKLLQQVKDTLQHGAWLPWLAENVAFSPRQAQRYLQVAAGRPLPIRAPANTTPVSHSVPVATFAPQTDSSYIYATGEGEIFLVEPSSEHPGFFFVSCMSAHDAAHTYTRRPVHADWVSTILKDFGLDDPDTAAWRTTASAGVVDALGTFEVAAA